jgi:transposase
MSVKTVAKVKRNLKNTRDPIIRERLLMVKAACEKPLREAAEDFGCTHGKIDFWKKRFEQYGILGLKTRRRQGRPPKITEEQSTSLKHTVSKKNMRQGWRTTRVRELIHKETGVKYTKRHTIRILQKWGMARVTPRQRYAHSKENERKNFLKKTRPTWRASIKQSGAL